MCEPSLHLSGRAGEGILFVQLPRREIQRSLFLCPQGMRSKASIARASQGLQYFIGDEVSMSWLPDKCGRRPHVLSSERWLGKVPRLMAIALLSLLPAVAVSSVGLPPVRAVSGSEPAAGSPPQKPLESGTPSVPPSQIDPGIHHVPEIQGDPRAAMKPPNLDPGISKNPDVAPPTAKGVNPPGSTPPGKPNLR